MAWLWIWIAAACEIVWAIGLKASDGFTKPKATVVTLVAYLASLAFLSRGVKLLPVGTSYAVWTGVGAVGTAALGILLFGDPATVGRLACIGLIVAGIAGLKLVS